MSTKIPLILAFLLLSSFSLFAQELLIPLSSAPVPTERSTAKSNGALSLPFFDDFADYEGFPDPMRWCSLQAWVGKDFAPQPPTVGMVTLDALDENGDLYPQASTSPFGADTLTSLPIRLDSLLQPIPKALTVADSIVLSFCYIPGGWYGEMWELVGDSPNPQDSLFLEAFSPVDSCWITLWATPGFTPDTSGIASHWPWHTALVKIDNPNLLSDRFQFRFRNIASLSSDPKAGIAGNCDQWNIDYIFLNYNRTLHDTTFRDIAFVHKAPSMLKKYQAMPARQYRMSDMAESLELTIANRYHQTLASSYSYSVYNLNGSFLAQYDGGYENIPAFFPSGTFQSHPLHANPAVNFTFPENDTAATYRITHCVTEGVGGDLHQSNDTLVFDQVFANYYAYDDGTAENGYGLTNASSVQYFAIRYELHVPDTLTALHLYFNRTRDGENELAPLYLCVWANDGGKPGTLLYRDEQVYYPEFEGMNHFHRYALTTPQVVADTVFIGFEQRSNTFLNLGFDRNTDSRSQTFYRTGNEWSNSFLKGSVMMRPLFGAAALVDIPSPEERQNKKITYFPNPVGETLFLKSPEDYESTESLVITLFNCQGRLLFQQPFCERLDVSSLSPGLYFLQFHDTQTGFRQYEKIVVSGR